MPRCFFELTHDENGNEEVLSEETVQFVVEKLMDFINLKYSLHRWQDIGQECQAAALIFPCIGLVSNQEPL